MSGIAYTRLRLRALPIAKLEKCLLGLLARCTQEQSAADYEEPDTCITAEETFDKPQNFLQIYERYYEAILNYQYRRVSDRDLAADLTSKTFLRALEWLQIHQIKNLRVKPWLYRIATTVHLQHARTERRWTWRMPLVGEWLGKMGRSAGEVNDQCLEENLIRKLLQELPEKYKAPIMLRYYEELSFRDIGIALGIAESSARCRVSRGLRKLAGDLKDTR